MRKSNVSPDSLRAFRAGVRYGQQNPSQRSRRRTINMRLHQLIRLIEATTNMLQLAAHSEHDIDNFLTHYSFEYGKALLQLLSVADNSKEVANDVLSALNSINWSEVHEQVHVVRNTLRSLANDVLNE